MRSEPDAAPVRPERTRRRFPALTRWDLDPARTAMLGGVVLVTLLVYLRCLENRFVYDDVSIVLHNKYIAQPSYIWKSLTRDLWWFLSPETLPASQFYHPLQGVWFGVAYQMFGPNPVGWHVLKIALHLIIVLLAFRVAQLLSGSVAVGLLTGLLFGIMPLHAEPVVWATDIPEPLSSAFELGSFCLFIQSRKDGWRGMVWPLVLYAGASFSHEMAVVFPLLIAVYVYLFETAPEAASSEVGAAAVSSGLPSMRGRVGRAAILSAPFFAIAAVYLATRAMVLGPSHVLGIFPRKATAALVGTSIKVHSVSAAHGVIATLITLPSYLASYLEVLFIPWLAGPAHNVYPVSKPDVHNFYIPLAILMVAAAACYFGVRRSPRRRLYSFCIAWWLITLSPALLNIDQVIAEAHDRYQYLGSFAFCLVLADLAIRSAHRDALRARLAGVCAAAVAVTYLVVLWRVQPLWHDDYTLFTHVTRTLPGSVHFHLALAGVLMQRGDLKGALAQYQDAEKVAPDAAGIHMALATVYMKLQRGKEASDEMEAYYRTAFALKQQTQVPHWSVTFK